MHVLATAGHVDHGKSTLVRALTGGEPDRLGEEHRRGLTIELGYCWTSLDRVGDVAFVDVPGHERFLPTMLSGVGPVPAALLVAAADDPWMPQAAEHLAALHALGVEHAVVALSRTDLADAGARATAAGRVRDEVDRTTLRGAPVVPVSGRTGAGLDDLRAAIAAMVGRLPDPDPGADVRLWVDRDFTVRGSGTVVTGTLTAGTLTRGDVLDLHGHPVRVRGLQSLGRPADRVTGVARVALNLAGESLTLLSRGSPLLTRDAWRPTDLLDVRLVEVTPGAGPVGTDWAGPIGEGPIGAGPIGAGGQPPDTVVLHVGAAEVAVHHRQLRGDLARLRVDPRERALPLRVGDRAVLRDPGSRRLWGAVVLDPAPPPLRRRGAAVTRAAALAEATGHPDPARELEQRGLVPAEELRRIGVPVDLLPPGAVEADGWLVGATEAERRRERVRAVVEQHRAGEPLAAPLPLAVVADRAGVPTPGLVAALAAGSPGLAVTAGRVARPADGDVPVAVAEAVRALREELAGSPYAAPPADRLGALGLDPATTAAAQRAGLVLRLAPGVVLLAEAADGAVEVLTGLAQPFTTSAARQALGTSRRVALPLLAHLDRRGLTVRHPDDTRTVR